MSTDSRDTYPRVRDVVWHYGPSHDQMSSGETMLIGSRRAVLRLIVEVAPPGWLASLEWCEGEEPRRIAGRSGEANSIDEAMRSAEIAAEELGVTAPTTEQIG